MSSLGKGLLIFALVGALAAGVMAYLVSQQYTGAKTDLAGAQQKAQIAIKQLAKAQDDTKTAQAAQKDAEDKATTDEGKLTDLTTTLTQAQKDRDDAKAAASKAQDDLTAAQQKLNDLTTSLGGQTPDQWKATIAQDQKDRDDAQSQLKVVQDQLQQSEDSVKKLTTEINASNQHLEPPGVSGKVTFVDRTWNFVVLDVGLDAGVVPNGELIVYRGKNFLGKIRVTRADPNDAVAEILPDVKGEIEVGDAVLN